MDATESVECNFAVSFHGNLPALVGLSVVNTLKCNIQTDIKINNSPFSLNSSLKLVEMLRKKQFPSPFEYMQIIQF